jgi:hypothetical protein
MQEASVHLNQRTFPRLHRTILDDYFTAIVQSETRSLELNLGQCSLARTSWSFVQNGRAGLELRQSLRQTACGGWGVLQLPRCMCGAVCLQEKRRCILKIVTLTGERCFVVHTVLWCLHIITL